MVVYSYQEDSAPMVPPLFHQLFHPGSTREEKRLGEFGGLAPLGGVCSPDPDLLAHWAVP